MTREELLKVAKPMVVNLEVAKTIPNKTQTRRVIKIPLDFNEESLGTTLDNSYSVIEARFDDYDNDEVIFIKPRWKAGDILWVREPAVVISYDVQMDRNNISLKYQFLSDMETKVLFDIPERFIDVGDPRTLPNWIRNYKGIPNGCIKEMARTFFRVTNVRVERIRNICIKDMIKEGYLDITVDNYEKNGTIGDQENVTNWFITLWNKTAPKGYKWEDNPYVFVYELEKVEVIK